MTCRTAASSRLPRDSRASRSPPSCRPMISSSSAPAPRVRSWPNACRRAAAIPCWCWRPAAPTGASTSRCRSATARPSSTPPSTGTTAPSPTPASPAIPTTGRAARSSAARARSTPWSGSGASARTSMPGPRPAIPAGPSTTCCRPSRRSRTTRPARTNGAAPAGRSTSPTAAAAVHPLTQRYLKAAEQAGLPLNPDFNGETPGRRRRLPDQRPRAAAACRPRAPSCGRR